MTRIIVKKLLWDEWNKQHIAKHKVTKEEVEKAVRKLIGHKKGNKGRYILIGRCEKRLLSIVVSRRNSGIYYVVTARDSDKKERKIVYEKEKKRDSKF